MIPVRRRAERFDALVEGIGSPGSDGAGSAEPYTQLLDLVGDLRAVAGPTPRPEFVSDLRASLMTEADAVLQRLDRDLAPPTARPPGQRRPHRRLAIAVGAVTFVGATASMSFASQSALPGDALYPVKRAIENAQTGLSSGEDKTEGILGNASARLDEVAALSDRGTAESDTQVPGTIHDFSEQAQEGARRALNSGDNQQITALRDFTASSMAQLESLDTVVPDQARDELASAATLLGTLDHRALTACPSCGGAVLDLPLIFLTSASDTEQTAPGQIVPSDPPATGQPSSGPSAGVPSGGLPTTSPDTPAGPGLPTSAGNGPLNDLTDRVLPTVTTSGQPDLPELPGAPDLPGPPATSALDDVTDGLGDLLDP